MATGDDTKPRRFIFLLLDRLSLLAFASAIEPLRLANRMAERELYRWSFASEDGAPVTSSCRATIAVDHGLDEATRDATIIVCSGIDVHLTASKPVLTWLRRESRRGVTMGSVCTGAYVLAKAGLLTGRRTTIHWENREGFEEEFPDVQLSSQIYVLDGDRLSAAGGSASADLTLRLIGDQHGADLAGMVADQMVYSTLRSEGDRQRLSVPARVGVRHPKLAEVINMMEEHIEEPKSTAEIASSVGMSTRQLERLFRRYLDRSPKRYYLELRLAKARRLLLQTDMSVINVALACGFTSPSHFSKCYRGHYNRTPYRERGVAAG